MQQSTQAHDQVSCSSLELGIHLNALQIKDRFKHIPKLKLVLKGFVDFFPPNQH